MKPSHVAPGGTSLRANRAIAAEARRSAAVRAAAFVRPKETKFTKTDGGTVNQSSEMIRGQSASGVNLKPSNAQVGTIRVASEPDAPHTLIASSDAGSGTASTASGASGAEGRKGARNLFWMMDENNLTASPTLCVHADTPSTACNRLAAKANLPLKVGELDNESPEMVIVNDNRQKMFKYKMGRKQVSRQERNTSLEIYCHRVGYANLADIVDNPHRGEDLTAAQAVVTLAELRKPRGGAAAAYFKKPTPVALHI
jgi:hypothetical protein